MPFGAARRARAAPAAVVLQADVDVVRTAHVGADPVGERGRHRVDEVPRPALVPADVEPAVVADQQVLRVLRVDPDRVLVDVTGRAVAAGIVERREGLAAVERLRYRQPGDVDRLVVRRIDAQLAEVHRPRVAVADVRPARALVVGAEDAAARRIERGRRRRRARGLLRAAPESAARPGVVAPVVGDAATAAPAPPAGAAPAGGRGCRGAASAGFGNRA